jgi:hypothetical protein
MVAVKFDPASKPIDKIDISAVWVTLRTGLVHTEK